MQATENIGGSRARVSTDLMTNLTGILLIFTLGSLVIGAGASADNVRAALSLCITSVIPTVFPIMVVSNAIVMGGGAALVEVMLGRFLGRIFRISPRGAVAVVLGFTCGAPVGAFAAARLWESGDISIDDLCHLMTFINNPGAAFVIYAVGGGMLGSVRLGVAIYACVILSALAAGLVLRPKKGARAPPAHQARRVCLPPSAVAVRSVSAAVNGSLNVCAYAAFFSSAMGILSATLRSIGASESLIALIYGAFELIGGTRALAACGDYGFGVIAVSAACSWSGISILMQVVAAFQSASGEGRLSFAPMILSKLFQAALTGLFMCIYLNLLV